MLRLSVLVATRDRSEDLLTCLRSVTAQSRRPDEIVIVDQSNVPATETVSALLAPAGIRLVYVHDPTLPGLTHARNRAVDLAAGQILLFIDDDVELLSGYLREMLAVFDADGEKRIGGAGGLIVNLPLGLSFLRRLRSWVFYRGSFGVERDALAFHLRPGTWPRPAQRLHGANMAFRREVFDHVRFDEWYSGYAFGEDRDFTVLAARRFALRWVPAARLVHRQSPRGRLERERFHELRVLSWLRFYDRCVDKTLWGRLCYLWLNIGFAVLLAEVWDWPTVRGTARGLRRLLAIRLGHEPLEHALSQGWGRT